jgi:hypothetical protein
MSFPLPSVRFPTTSLRGLALGLYPSRLCSAGTVLSS